MARDKDSWIKFFGMDWRGDTNLQLCNLEARGLWIEMMAIMMDCIPHGHLTHNGAGMSTSNLAALVRIEVSTCENLLKQLRDNHVFSTTPEGVIFSRRMVRDKYLRQVRSEAGRQGGNASFCSSKKSQIVSSKPSRARAPALDSGILVSGTLDSQEKEEDCKGKEKPIDGFPEFWKAYPRKVAKADAEKAWAKLQPGAELRKLILASVTRQAEGRDWRKDGGRFIPYPATWLNGRRWGDEENPMDDPVVQVFGEDRGGPF